MGVGRGFAAAGALIALGAAVLGATGPATVSTVAGLALGGVGLLALGRRWPELGAGIAAVGLAPVLVAAVHRGDASGAVALAGGSLMLAMRRGVLPGSLPAALVGLGVVEAARAVLASDTLAIAWVAAAPLALAGLGAAAACALPATPRLLGAGMLAGAALAAASRTRDADGTLADAVRRAQVGLPSDPGPSLARRLAFIAARPAAHSVAEGVVAEHGPELPLQAGWRPQGAGLAPDARIAAAAWLESRGRGGEGRRLLAGGRSDPRVAWWWRLSRRVEGLDDGEARPTTPPPETPRVPGRLDLGETLLTNSTRTWAVHAEAPCLLRIEASGEGWHGPARVVLRVDARDASTWDLPVASGEHTLGMLAEGPHRVRLRFANDASGPGGDRNVHLHALDCVAP